MQPDRNKAKQPGAKKQIAAPQKQKSNEGKTFNSLNVLLALIVALTGFLLYVNTLHHEFVLDDYSVIIENRITRQGTASIGTIFTTSYRAGYYLVNDELYRPIPKALYALIWEISPNNPLPGHLINILLYALTGFVLYFFLWQIIKSSFFAFAASLLFIAHPIHTEVVANIKSIDEILSFLFCITSASLLLKYLHTSKKRLVLYASVFYFMALLCKESSITFLAIFPLLIFFFAPADKPRKFTPLIYLTVAAVVFLVIRQAVLGNVPHGLPSIADNLLMSAPDLSKRFATAVLILGMYLKLLFFPHPLVFDYSYNQIPVVSLSDMWSILSLIIHIALLAIAVIQFNKNKIICFGILFYLVSMSIYANIFLIIGSSFAERFLYTPSLGFAIVVAWFLLKLTTHKNGSTLFSFFSQNKAALLILLPIIILYSAKTIARNPVWKSNYSLYSNDVKLSPNSTRTHFYYGNLLAKPEMVEGKDSVYTDSIRTLALSELEKAVAIFPKFGDAYNQMGMTWERMKKYDKAMESYQ